MGRVRLVECGQPSLIKKELDFGLKGVEVCATPSVISTECRAVGRKHWALALAGAEREAKGEKASEKSLNNNGIDRVRNTYSAGS